MEQKKYDVFISCKSEDYSKAEPIYHWLVANGHRPFFAQISLKISKIHGEPVVFGDEIDEALDEAENMIVFTSNAEYVKKGYVKDEWRTYVEEQRTGRKSGMLITILDRVRIEELPIRLRSVQSFDLSNYKDGVLRFLGDTIHTKDTFIDQAERKRREEEERAKEKIFNDFGVPFKMIRVEGGSMGTFYIGETQVTQALWQAVMGNNPSCFKGQDHPVESVSWNDICGENGTGTDPDCFLYKLNKKTGKKFRLPTEAEWEYAAKGGRKGRGYEYSGCNSEDELEQYAWYDKNAFYCGSSGSNSSHPDYGTHSVKTRKPNELDIYDMSGNVWEWCQDLYSTDSSGRVLRGGSWGSNAGRCRVAFRRIGSPGGRSYSIGFRLALDYQ